MRLLRKTVILAHRYLGIGICLLAVMWFATGITMMYAGGMPRLTPELRLEQLPEIDPARVKLTPAEAADRAGVEEAARVTLVSVMDRPAYRIGGRAAQTVFADTGEILEDISLAQSRTVASRFVSLPEAQIHHVATLTKNDQWTLTQGRQMPLHKFRVDDSAGTELYVAPSTADVVQITTRRGRMLAWISTIPHWMYFTALRLNQPVWYRIVVWTSAAVCVVAVLGLVLGVTQFRRRKPFSLATAIPYSGFMRWHYITGVVFGVFTLTWAFSGLLSMEPFAWTNATGLEVRRDAFTGGPLELASFPSMEPAAWRRIVGSRALKEVEFVRIQDEHFYVVRSTEAPTESKRPERLHQPYYITGRAEPDKLLVSASTLEVRRDPFSVDTLMARLEAAVPGVPILDHQLLTEYDWYYYSRGRLSPLPVLRVKFDDPAQTWVYIDPEMSQVLAQVHKYSRVERWLYNGLHSLDFAFWYNRRPLWDIGMIALLLGGLASSGIGVLIGVRRLRRSAAGAVRSLPDLTPVAEPERSAQ